MRVGEWQSYALGDLVGAAGGVIKTGPFGSQLHALEYTDDPGGVPVVMPKDMLNGRIARGSVSRVSETVAERLRVHRLAAGDLVLARRGDVGRLAFVESDEAGWLCGTGSMRIHAPDHGVLDPQFLRYAMSAPAVADWFGGQAVGATMPNLNARIVSGVPISAPRVSTQRRIAAVLSAFDQLIEINERRIALLEDLARSLYREWFVHFRFPGHEDVELVESELGSIPEGWEVASLGSTAQWFSGGTPNTKNPIFWDGDIPWISSGSLKSMLLDRSDRSVTPEGAAAGSRIVERDTLLFVVRGMSLVREFRVGLAERSLAFGQDCKALVACDGVEPLYLALSVFERRDDIQGMVELAGHGTGKLSTDRLKAVKYPLPPESVQRAFVEAVTPIREVMGVQTVRNRRLAAIRELLLPRLVTGRLDISDIDLGVLTPLELE